MAKEFILHNTDGLQEIAGYVFEHFGESKKPLKVVITNFGKRSLSQNAFQHVIYGEISKYLISKGRSDWTPEFVKEQLKNKFLGWEEKEYIDVVSGQRATRSVLRKTSTLDKGDSFRFTTEILGWAESIGCFIKIPDDCDYMRFTNEQNE